MCTVTVTSQSGTDKMVQGVDSCVNYVSKEDIPWKIRQKKICQKKILSKEVRRYVRPQADRCTVVRGRCDIHATRQVLLSTHRTARRESGRERRSRETRAPAAPGPRRTSSISSIFIYHYLAPRGDLILKCPGCIYNY